MHPASRENKPSCATFQPDPARWKDVSKKINQQKQYIQYTFSPTIMKKVEHALMVEICSSPGRQTCSWFANLLKQLVVIVLHVSHKQFSMVPDMPNPRPSKPGGVSTACALIRAPWALRSSFTCTPFVCPFASIIQCNTIMCLQNCSFQLCGARPQGQCEKLVQ